MKKSVLAVLVCFMFFALLHGVQAGFIAWMFGQEEPGYSPFPGYAPFNATVTIADVNTAPIIHNVTDPIFVCEDTILSSWFNVTDEQGDALEIKLNPPFSPIFPFQPFFVSPIFTPSGGGLSLTTSIELRSQNLTNPSFVDMTQGHRTFIEEISAVELFTPIPRLLDTYTVPITVIERNDPPQLTSFGTLTIETYTQGEDSTFYRVLGVTDEEDGTLAGGNLILNMTFLNGPHLFNITSLGVINYTPNETTYPVQPLPQTSLIQICVGDMGITPTHANIVQYCGQDGSPATSCFNFSLTVTNQNRAPVIDSFYPVNLSFTASGETDIYFNVSAHDPDGNPYMDMNWTVNGVQEKIELGVNISNFTYAFPCGVSGLQFVNITVSDGIANTTMGWNFTLVESVCPTPQQRSGGGGGGRRCVENWACSDYNVCQHALTSLEIGGLTVTDYTPIQMSCANQSLDENNCGFHLRTCYDVNNCSTSFTQPDTLVQCHYTENPSCSDGIANCHSGACETLTDCGGPCDACATCSDGEQNQGEFGVDCGGPCPFGCPPEIPLQYGNIVRILIWAILLLFILIILIKIRSIIRARRDIAQALVAQEEAAAIIQQ